MSRDIEATITELKKLLPYVARDAERYRNPTELVTKSHEFHMAARAIDETLAHPSLASLSRMPTLRLRIGSKVVEAYGMQRNAYDLLNVHAEKAEPGEEHDLRYKHRIATDIFDTRHSQPIYGQLRYFDLATIGRTLEEGGDLFAAEPLRKD